MKKIGIILRKDISTSNNDVYLINKEVIKVININNIKYELIIPDKNIINSIQDCSGFLFQGGSYYNKYDLKLLKICQEENIPTLGICLGMQLMALNNNAEIKKINSVINHNQKIDNVHSVKLNKNSKLYNIINIDKIMVNSRHNDEIVNSTLNVSSIATDGVIESVEDSSKNCFIGVGWHIETNYEYNVVSKKIFEYFFKCVGEYYENKKVNRNS